MPFPTYDAVLGAIYDASARPQHWARALEQVADHVGGSGAMLAYSDFKRKTGFIVAGRLREDLSKLYVDRYTDNPLSDGVRRRRIVAPVMGSTLAEPAALRRSAMHADILQPQRIADQAIMGVKSLLSNETSGGFSVTLTQRQADRGSDVLEKLSRLAPHLARATQLSLDLARHRDEAHQLASLLEALPSAALLLGKHGRLIDANRRAEALLRAGDGLAATDRLLRAAFPPDERRLQALIASAEEGHPRAIRIARASGLPPYLLIATALPASAFSLRALVDDAATLLIQLVDPVDRSQQATGMLRQAFGLTSAEARVAALVGTGVGTPQIAVALGLTVNTVRTHIGHCFEKTGVRSQVALARLMASIANR